MYENYLFYYRVTTFYIKCKGQEKEEISYEKGETETYEIISQGEYKSIFRIGPPFNERAPLFDVPIKKYRLWPQKTIVNDKEYIRKYILPYIKEELTTKNGHLGISICTNYQAGK